MNCETQILNKKLSLPLYEQLKVELTRLIVSGHFKKGKNFYSLSEIIRKYKVSLITARRAVNELVEEGYLKTSQGKKTSVCPLPLKTGSSPALSIAVFFHSQTDSQMVQYNEMPWTTMIFSGIQEKLLEKGVLWTMAPAESSADALVKFEQIGSVHDAFICISFSLLEGLLAKFENSKRPYVIIQPDNEKQVYNFVAADYYAGSAEIARKAILKKYRSFLYLSRDFEENPEKMRGFQEALLKADIPPENIYIRSAKSITTANEHAAAAATFETFVEKEGKRKLFPLAVYSFGDLLSGGVLAACQKLGIKVPEEVGVAGSTGITEAECTVPPLTTMQIPMRKMGHAAVNMMFEMLTTGNYRLPGIKLDVKIVKRESL